MLEAFGRAIVPANAHPELSGLRNRTLYRSRYRYANGVLDGLNHHSVQQMAAE
jgi:hydroxymethylpyrimidine pyrophosphatase-like HAD family hydrolase